MRRLAWVGLLMVACSHYRWTKPGGTPEMKKADRYECERDARYTFRERGQTFTDIDEDFYDRCMESRGWTKERI